MASAEQHGRKLKRELSSYLRDQDRAKLRLLRAKINAARVERRHAVTAARGLCRTARVKLKAKQAAERAKLRLKQAAEREALRAKCLATIAEARKNGTDKIGNASAEFREALALNRQLERTRSYNAKAFGRTSKSERRQESDDEVRANLPEELVPVFDATRKTISGSDRRSRTEAFLEWAEAHPEDVYVLQQESADLYLTKLLEEQEEHKKAVRKRGRYSQSPEKLRELLADVPF